MPIEFNGNLYFTQNWYGKTSQIFTHSFNCQKADEISNYNFHINPIQSVYLFSIKIYFAH